MSYSLKLFGLCTVIFGVVLMGINWLVDPLQYYRQAENPVFNNDHRYQIPGLIRNYEFDTIILGTSLSQNFLSSELDRRSGGTSINMAIAGSSGLEQAAVARMALASGKVDNIVWELNYRSFSGEHLNMLATGEFPDFLYEPNWLTHVKYLFAFHTLWWSARSVMGMGARNLEYLHYWGKKRASGFDGKRARLQFCQIITNGGRDTNPDRYDVTVEQNLAVHVRAYPEVTFDVFFPPLSYLNFLIEGETEAFEKFRNEVYEVAATNSNVRLHDFMDDFSVIGDVNNYKDVEHFSPEISQRVLDRIADTEDAPDHESLASRRSNLSQFLAEKQLDLKSCPSRAQMAELARRHGIRSDVGAGGA